MTIRDNAGHFIADTPRNTQQTEYALKRRDRLWARYQELESFTQLAADEGVTQNTVWRIVSTHPDYRPLGVANHTATDFTDDEIAIFRRMWAEGQTTAVIGKALHRTRNSIVGKRRRLGLPKRPSPIVGTSAEHKKSAAAARRERFARRIAAEKAALAAARGDADQRAAAAQSVVQPSLGLARVTTAPEPRGRPGVALPPIGRRWPDIREAALLDGYALGSVHDLVGYNRARIARGYAPLAVAR